MRIPRHATTQLEQDRVSEAHTDYDLRRTRIPEQTLVIAVPWRNVVPSQSSSSPHHLLLCTTRCQKGCDPTSQVNRLCETEGLACGRAAPCPYSSSSDLDPSFSTQTPRYRTPTSNQGILAQTGRAQATIRHRGTLGEAAGAPSPLTSTTRPGTWNLHLHLSLDLDQNLHLGLDMHSAS